MFHDCLLFHASMILWFQHQQHGLITTSSDKRSQLDAFIDDSRPSSTTGSNATTEVSID